MAKVWRKHYSAQRPPARRFDRLTFLAAAIFLFSGFVIYRLFILQVMQHPFYAALASDQHDIYEKLIPERGEILVHDKFTGDRLYPVATNKTYHLVYAIPKQIEDPKKTADAIAPLLDVKPEDILPRLEKKDDLYEPLKRQVPDETMEKIKALNITGIKSSEDSYRYYPEGKYFSHIIGFVGFQGDERIGQYGLEGYFEKELAGQTGFLQAQMDANGRWITVGNSKIQEAVDGSSLVLTIDRTVQFTVCDKLAKAVQKHGADSGSAIVINPKTGAIIAMCNAPDYDPNKYNEVKDASVYINRAIYAEYEPGSVFKAMTMAAALNEGAVGPNSKYTDTGSVEIGKYTIRNADNKVYGEQTMTQVLENSINTGAMYAAEKVGNEKFRKYMQDFGFGEKTGVTLQTETAGDIGSLDQMKDIYRATASFGQGLTVTPLQLIDAYAAIANGGKLMKPYLVDEIISPDDYHKKTEPEEVRQVLSSKTAATLGAMLVQVVENGHGKNAGVHGYYIAGKTGTAQVPKKDGVGYDPSKNIGSFAGFGPVEDPVFAMVVRIDVPRDVMWAESSAAPLFGEIADFLLNYYEVPPTRTEQE